MSKKCSKPYTGRDKWIVSIIAGVLFLLLSSPFTYTLINGFTQSLGLTLSKNDGCPYMSGLLVHTALFVLVVRLLMR